MSESVIRHSHGGASAFHLNDREVCREYASFPHRPIAVNLEDRFGIYLAPIQKPKHDTKDEKPAEHEHRPVHRLRRRMRLRRPKREERADDAVQERDDVDHKPAAATQFERSLRNFRVGRRETFHQQDAAGEEEDGVKSGDDEAGEGVERFRGPDVDDR